MMSLALPLVFVLALPSSGHTRITGHVAGKKAKHVAVARYAPLRSAISMPVSQPTKMATPSFSFVRNAPKRQAQGSFPWNYRNGLRTEAMKTIGRVPASERNISQGQIAELQRAINTGSLTPMEAEGLQSDLATVRTKPAGSLAVREAISHITERLQYAGVSSTTVASVEDTLKKASPTTKR